MVRISNHLEVHALSGWINHISEMREALVYAITEDSGADSTSRMLLLKKEAKGFRHDESRLKVFFITLYRYSLYTFYIKM